MGCVKKSSTLLSVSPTHVSLQFRVSDPTPVPILFIHLPMPVLVMPISPRHIPSNAIITLRLLHHLHVDIYDAHAFLAAIFCCVAQRADKREGHARETHVVFIAGIRWTPGVGKDDGAGVFKSAHGQGRRYEEVLRERIEGQAGIAAIAQGPEGGDNNHLGAGCDQFTECFGEGEIPADEQAYRTEGGLDNGMRVVSAGG